LAADCCKASNAPQRALRLRGNRGFVGGTQAGIVGNTLKLRHERIAELLLIAEQLLVQRVDAGQLLVGEFAWDVLRKNRDEGKAEALIEIGDELVARHLFKRAVIAKALLEGQVPVHVVGVPPGILQALPEKPSLANAANLVTARGYALFAILPHEFAQRMHQLRLQILEPLVVWP
jgi:hypothetical protein